MGELVVSGRVVIGFRLHSCLISFCGFGLGGLGSGCLKVPLPFIRGSRESKPKPLAYPDAPNVWIIYIHMKGEKWSTIHVGKYNIQSSHGSHMGNPSKGCSTHLPSTSNVDGFFFASLRFRVSAFESVDLGGIFASF